MDWRGGDPLPAAEDVVPYTQPLHLRGTMNTHSFGHLLRDNLMALVDLPLRFGRDPVDFDWVRMRWVRMRWVRMRWVRMRWVRMRWARMRWVRMRWYTCIGYACTPPRLLAKPSLALTLNCRSAQPASGMTSSDVLSSLR